MSDFGVSDPYVGIVHGVLERVGLGRLRVVDLTHEIRAFSIVSGAYVLYTSYRWFPPGTVFLAVVDPGVGTERRALAVETSRYYLVGPDNGLLWPVIEEDGAERVHVIANEDLFIKPVSKSFHGRDIFAPVAAHLALGGPVEAVGPRAPVETLKRLRLVEPCPPPGEETVEALVVHVDRFGNAALGIEARCLARLCVEGRARVQPPRGPELEARCLPVFSRARPGELVLYRNSLGFPELAVNLGSAAERLSVEPGARVKLRPGPKK